MSKRTGRPTMGLGHVDRLDGSKQAQMRLRAVLRTLMGELSIQEACDELGIKSSRFAKVRDAALKGALDALEPKSPGRPRKGEPQLSAQEVEALRAEHRRLEEELVISRAREELSAILPRPGPRASDDAPSRRSPGPSSSKAAGKKGLRSPPLPKRRPRAR